MNNLIVGVPVIKIMNSDVTVEIKTIKWKYVFFHVKINEAKQCQILYSKGYKGEIWNILHKYEFGKSNDAGEKWLGKEKIKEESELC